MEPWPPVQNSTFEEVYPERKGKGGESSLADKATGKERRQQLIGDCQKQVIGCFENVPYLKLLWSSLASQGCAPDLNRHFSCELCQDGIKIEHAGNYDHEKNQVIFFLKHKIRKFFRQNVM